MNLTPPHLGDGARWRGLRIGLLGGSFNPPHAGHLHIAKIAKACFGLDFVWWLVTPHNPLKDKSQIAPYDQRFAQVEDMTAPDPAMMATHLERDIGSRYSYETIVALRRHFPHTDFLWICGMDNAQIFHKWERWRDILALMPMTFIARPPAGMLVKNCPLRRVPLTHRTKTSGRHTDLRQPGIFWLPGMPMLDISSTKIRSKTIT